MPRSLSSGVLAAIASNVVSLAIFAEIAFADNTFYVFSGVNSITPAGPPALSTSTFPYGETFTGLGWLAKLSGVPQTTKVQAQNVTISLSGIPSNLVSEAVAQVRVTGTITIWLGFFNPSTGALINDPVQIYVGGLDVPSISDGGDTSVISITCENPLLSLNLAPSGLFDDADQQIRFPGDLGLSFVTALANLELFWPSPANSGSPYAVYVSIALGAPDIAVGGTTTIAATIHYSDGSTFTVPGGSGSGPHLAVTIAMSDPAVATFSYSTFEITGISPGETNIMARIPTFGSGTTPANQYRANASIVVHS